MSDNVAIVPANLQQPEHADAVVSLLDHYASGDMGGGQPLPTVVRQTLVDELQQQSGCVVLLAYLGDDPIGLAIAFTGFSTFQARKLLNVHDLAVHEKARGRGVGKALLAAIESEAKRIGCSKVTLEVRSDNEVAMGLYRKLGFGPSLPGAEAMYFWAKPLD